MPGIESKRFLSTKQFSDVLSTALDHIDKLPYSNLSEHLQYMLRSLPLRQETLSNVVVNFRVFDFSRMIHEDIAEQSELSEAAKASIELLLAYTFVGSDEDDRLSVRSSLLSIWKRLQEKQVGVTWMYELVTKQLHSHELQRLIEAYYPGKDVTYFERKFGEEKNTVDARKLPRYIGKLLGSFLGSEPEEMQDVYQDEGDSDARSSSEEDADIVAKLLTLYTKHYHRDVIAGSSSSFLGLDHVGREAVCWRELEMSRSGNEFYARLCALIAWKTWLFKKPLLKEYCVQKDIDHTSLTISERATYTQEAVAHFSPEQCREILEQAIETEIERRKRVFTEEKEEYKGKKVSIGVELEIIEPPHDVAVLFAWYENIDRELQGEKPLFAEEIAELFPKLAAWKDAENQAAHIARVAGKVEALHEQLENRTEAPDSPEEEKVQQLDLLKQAVSLISREGIRKPFQAFLKKNTFEALDVAFTQMVLENLRKEMDLRALKVKESKMAFYSFAQQNDLHGYGNMGYEGSYIPLSHKDIDTQSTTSLKLFDAFKHLMGQSQSLGHFYSWDSLGEYALLPLSGDFKDPYGAYAREIWEMAHVGFHDLEVEERPMHITLGWEPYLERGIYIPSESVYQESSILNVATIATGCGYRKYIDDFKAEDAQAKADGKDPIIINKYGDSGRSTILRPRYNDSKSNMKAIEFRGFAPSKNDIPRLFKQLGYLGTAMIASIAVDYADEYDASIVDGTDRKLAAVWVTFKEKMEKVYAAFPSFPPLEIANSWSESDLVFNDSGDYERRYPAVTDFYREIANSIDEPVGFVADVRAIVSEAERGVKEVFSE